MTNSSHLSQFLISVLCIQFFSTAKANAVGSQDVQYQLETQMETHLAYQQKKEPWTLGVFGQFQKKIFTDSAIAVTGALHLGPKEGPTVGATESPEPSSTTHSVSSLWSDSRVSVDELSLAYAHRLLALPHFYLCPLYLTSELSVPLYLGLSRYPEGSKYGLRIANRMDLIALWGLDLGYTHWLEAVSLTTGAFFEWGHQFEAKKSLTQNLKIILALNQRWQKRSGAPNWSITELKLPLGGEYRINNTVLIELFSTLGPVWTPFEREAQWRLLSLAGSIRFDL